ncbi:3-dehydroquinate dehydratase [Streptomyces sp. ISL-12]|uniref:type II 3-dehydroquinate dehydratase n=1 Tax=Streptomyces sp. ISL-12 TaxID=2819177 RepID=UPI001BE99128|nr:type II 3-dehydroquinate dehydratase [Streptomyces sp. ISL-12]MBT2412480.1 3-dehydroquinate dehydratase [Streptomyces sp. ISL-12]
MTDSSTSYGWRRPGARALHITLIDGPNMPNLGHRNKRVYGPISSIEALHDYVKEAGAGLGVTVETMTSNHEGAILDTIHESAPRTDAYILNPAGLTKTGEAVRHALEETGKPWIETHFSNISAPPWSGRGLPGGPWESNFTRSATGMSMGLRHHSYLGALISLVSAFDDEDFLGKEAE